MCLQPRGSLERVDASCLCTAVWLCGTNESSSETDEFITSIFPCSNNLLCSYFLSGKPTCRCPVGFSGPFCEKRICDNYCLNGGTCDVTQGNQPVCRCMAEYTGDRCLYRESCWQQTNTNSHWCSPGCLWLPVAPNQKKIIDLNSVMSQKNHRTKRLRVPTLSKRQKQSPQSLFFPKTLHLLQFADKQKSKFSHQTTFGCFCTGVIMYFLLLHFDIMCCGETISSAHH